MGTVATLMMYSVPSGPVKITNEGFFALAQEGLRQSKNCVLKMEMKMI
jgi:hypothetical protein